MGNNKWRGKDDTFREKEQEYNEWKDTLATAKRMAEAERGGTRIRDLLAKMRVTLRREPEEEGEEVANTSHQRKRIQKVKQGRKQGGMVKSRMTTRSTVLQKICDKLVPEIDCEEECEKEEEEEVDKHDQYPLIIKGKQPNYVPWTFMDVTGLINKLPSVCDGAQRWMTRFEEQTTGQHWAVGDLKYWEKQK